MLDFDKGECGCLKEKEKLVVVGDPEEDIIKKVDAEIYSSISEILSEIVKRAISNSLTDVIQIDDTW